MCNIPSNQNASKSAAPPIAAPPPMTAIARASNNAADATKSTAPAASQALAASDGVGTPSPAATQATAQPTSTPAPQAVGSPTAAAAPATSAGGSTATVSNDGTATGFNATHYGYADDKYKDKYTQAHEGKYGDLRPDDSLALTDSMASKLGVQPGDPIQLADAKGNTRNGTYIDRAPESDDRIDIYDPKGSEKAGVPFNAVSARKIPRKSLAESLYPNNPRT